MLLKAMVNKHAEVKRMENYMNRDIISFGNLAKLLMLESRFKSYEEFENWYKMHHFLY